MLASTGWADTPPRHRSSACQSSVDVQFASVPRRIVFPLSVQDETHAETPPDVTALGELQESGPRVQFGTPPPHNLEISAARNQRRVHSRKDPIGSGLMTL